MLCSIAALLINLSATTGLYAECPTDVNGVSSGLLEVEIENESFGGDCGWTYLHVYDTGAVSTVGLPCGVHE